MALSKLCSRCQCTIPYTDKLCDSCTNLIGTPRRMNDKLYRQYRNDKEYQAIYVSVRWKHIRKVALTKANGLCECCIKLGKIRCADEVHHIVPVKDDINKAYSLDNLICLCRTCHRQAHKELEREKLKGRGTKKSF